jgi:hypothetical protein
MTELTSIKDRLAKLKPELQERFFLNSIGLFGSVVREDFTPSSDVDIIVDFTKAVGIEFIDVGNFIEAQLDKKIDLVSRNGVKKRYFEQIEPEIVYV